MRNDIKLLLVSFFISIFIWNHAVAKEISIESLLPKNLPEGWKQIGIPQAYNQKNLFNRINGQAELFFKYGFQKSVFALYQNKSNSKDQIEVDFYDMGNALQAFGIFSRFRGENRSAGVGLESYLEDTSLLFYKGRYFVMLYATEADSSTLIRLATTISSEIPDASASPKEIDYFPKDGLKPGSIEYHPEGLLGYQFFKRGFQGVYLEKAEEKEKIEAEAKGEDKAKGKVEVKDEVKECYLFLALFGNSEEVMRSLEAYRSYLSQKGNVHPGGSTPFGSNALNGEDPYKGKVIVVAKGFYLAGIIGFENLKSAEKLLEGFVKNIR